MHHEGRKPLDSLPPGKTCVLPTWRTLRCVLVTIASGLLFTACVTAGPLGLGPIAVARTRRADLFTLDCFARLGDRYVVCGHAERFDTDDSPKELVTESRLDAEARLAANLNATALELSDLSIAHEWSACGGRVVVANFTVPIGAVAVAAPRSRSVSVPPRSVSCPVE
jgi:hypothetical protein